MQLKTTGPSVAVAPFRGCLGCQLPNLSKFWKPFKDQLQLVATGLIMVYIKYNTYTNTYVYTNNNVQIKVLIITI